MCGSFDDEPTTSEAKGLAVLRTVAEFFSKLEQAKLVLDNLLFVGHPNAPLGLPRLGGGSPSPLHILDVFCSFSSRRRENQ